MAGINLSAFERNCKEELDDNRGCNDRVRGVSEERECNAGNNVLGVSNNLDPRRLREECIIAFKVYDSCRQQDCLEEPEIGFARAAEDICICDENIREGDVIDPPSDTAAVVIDRLKVKKITILNKRPNELRRGFWDIDIKYVFEYKLTFLDARGDRIISVRANSIFIKKVTLFGSVGSDLVISTDLFKFNCDDGQTLEGDPFVLVEAKAVSLNAKLRYQRRINSGREDLSPQPNAVVVTIGLFTIIKIFRIVNLTVESRGFCIPVECEEISPINPCELFDNLDFPMDVFAPPQRPEFLAGVSENIPPNKRRNCKSC